MERLTFNQDLQTFLKLTHRDSSSIGECMQDVQKAVASIADMIRIGDVTLHIKAPVSKLRPEGLDRTVSIYHYEGEISTHEEVFTFHLPDSGTCVITVKSRMNDSYSEQDIQNLDYIFTEVFLKFARFNTLSLLDKVLYTDLETGAASASAFMKFSGGLIHRGLIDRYNVIFFNVHNFKYVNKVFSYAEGDVILRRYTELILSQLEQDEILARLGGDNYVSLIKKENVETFIRFLQNTKLRHEAESKKNTFVFGATIGYSNLDDIHTPRDIMSRASIAYNSARRAGGGAIVEYSDTLRHQLMARQEVLSDFHAALKNSEFVIYYQPKVDTKKNTICGAEALVRWIKNGTVVPPAKFIPLLEQEGSICNLDFYVLREVCAFLKRRIDAGQSPICISVNFSRRHLEDADLVSKALEIIDHYEVEHKYIEIELTESNNYQNYKKIHDIINELRENGVSTSMDDFGTGFSSLNMIKEANLDVIKIDKSLIPLDKASVNRDKDQIIFENLIHLIDQLGKKAIAEGVETPEQLKCVQRAGCRIIQGFIFDKPLPEEEFIKRLDEGYTIAE